MSVEVRQVGKVKGREIARSIIEDEVVSADGTKGVLDVLTGRIRWYELKLPDGRLTQNRSR